MCPQAKDPQGLLAVPRSEGRGPEQVFPPSLQKEPTLPTPRSLTSGLQNCGRTNFCCSEPTSLGHFVSAALGNWRAGRVLLLVWALFIWEFSVCDNSAVSLWTVHVSLVYSIPTKRKNICIYTAKRYAWMKARKRPFLVLSDRKISLSVAPSLMCFRRNRVEKWYKKMVKIEACRENECNWEGSHHGRERPLFRG